jgi:hypothetical protein
MHKILITGDSHVRGCSNKLVNLLGSSYSVTGISKPNADLKAVTSSINIRFGELNKKDLIIVCGGMIDIARNETKKGLKHLTQFAESTANTNVIMMTVAQRCDLQPFSCVNKEVNRFNRKLEKFIKVFNHIQICNMSLNPAHYTCHGLHMNNLWKNWITSI